MRHMVECNAYNPLFSKIIFYNKVETVFIGKLGCKINVKRWDNEVRR